MEPTTTTITGTAALIAEIASGPAAATVILAILLFGLGYGFFVYGLPALTNSLEIHKKALADIIASNEKNLKDTLAQHSLTTDKMLAEHRADREAWQGEIRMIGSSIERLSDRLGDVEDALKDMGRNDRTR